VETSSDDRPSPRQGSAQPSTRPSAARRRARLRRRLAGLLLFLVPTAWVVSTDLLRRAHLVAAFDAPHRKGYLASIVESLVFWTVLLCAGSRRRGLPAAVMSGVFLVLFTLAMGVEGAFHGFYNIYLSMDGQIHSKSVPWSIVGTLPFSRPIVIAHMLAALGLGAALVYGGRRFLRVSRWPFRVVSLFVPAVVYAAGTVPVSYRTLQSTPFDMIYFHGLGALVRETLGFTHDSPDLRVQRRAPESVPRLTPKPARPRNVLFVLQESQRADVTCIEPDPACKLATRFTNPLLPDRLPLMQMRSNASTTAISISNLWSGVRPTESRELLHAVPLIWDYAHAAGYDTAYWTSQNLMFGNARLYVQDIPVSHRCVATELDTQADLDTGAYDSLVTDRVIKEFHELKEPFLAVVHYSNVHFPYVYDESYAPFQPADEDKSADKNELFKNYYKDVVYLSDMAVARMIKHVRESDAGKRTVIVYTSDHGESFREHWQLGHTSSLYDEEIHVPGWIDAPPGTLAPEEEASIKAAKDELVWHLDLSATFFDLLGLWDDPAFAPFRARMMGHPITRRERTLAPMPLTNCTWVWECAFRNWGMMQGPLKLEAREWDNEYHCFNVLEDPDEQNNLGEQACWPLPDLARATYHVMPIVVPPGRPRTDWGKK
jgi:glucan phosphoethanolaminetransferase (alkaline phosphatase superfamily)